MWGARIPARDFLVRVRQRSQALPLPTPTRSVLRAQVRKAAQRNTRASAAPTNGVSTGLSHGRALLLPLRSRAAGWWCISSQPRQPTVSLLSARAQAPARIMVRAHAQARKQYAQEVCHTAPFALFFRRSSYDPSLAFAHLPPRQPFFFSLHNPFTRRWRKSHRMRLCRTTRSTQDQVTFGKREAAR